MNSCFAYIKKELTPELPKKDLRKNKVAAEEY